jgi:hypothetical protein
MSVINNLSSYLYRSDKFKLISFIFLVLSTISYFLPLIFIDQLPDNVKQSTLADTIRCKDDLRLAYLCSIFTTIPLIIDILLDLFSNLKNLNYNDRILILLMVIIPGILFVVYHDNDKYPYIAIGFFKLQFSVMIHITISYIVEFAPVTFWPTIIIHLGLFAFYLSNILHSISILVSSQWISSIFITLYYIAFVLSILNLTMMTYRWLKYIYTLHGDMTDNKHRNECFMISSYFSVLWLSIVAHLVASSISSFDLYKFNEISCLVYVIHFTVIAALLSVLPG